MVVVDKGKGVRGRRSFLLGSAPDFSPGCYYYRAIFDLCGCLDCRLARLLVLRIDFDSDFDFDLDSDTNPIHVISPFIYLFVDFSGVFGVFQRYRLTFRVILLISFPRSPR